jgi:hypothetical protein
MHHVDLSTLTEARLFIEKGTAELAAQRATLSDIQSIFVIRRWVRGTGIFSMSCKKYSKLYRNPIATLF